MNNGKIRVTNIAVAYDVATSTEITIRNTGENDVSIGFGDLDSTFVFGDGIMLKIGETMSIDNTDPRRGDGTFYAVTKNTTSTAEGQLSYAADGGVAPTLLYTANIDEREIDVAIDVIPTITFSNDIDELTSQIVLIQDGTTVIAGTAAVVDNVYTFTPDANLANEADFQLAFRAIDVNDKVKADIITFTTVAA